MVILENMNSIIKLENRTICRLSATCLNTSNIGVAYVFARFETEYASNGKNFFEKYLLQNNFIKIICSNYIKIS